MQNLTIVQKCKEKEWNFQVIIIWLFLREAVKFKCFEAYIFKIDSFGKSAKSTVQIRLITFRKKIKTQY